MAKKFSKSFYNSKAWKKCREGYFHSQNGICEICGNPGEEVHHKKYITPTNINNPEITLNWDNLQLLCKNCHNAIHEKSYHLSLLRGIKNKGIAKGLKFDDKGQVIKDPHKVKVVWGAPCSGKTTYVLKNKEALDIVWDFDYIVNALYLNKVPSVVDTSIEMVKQLRETFFKTIENELYDYSNNIWIIGTLPLKKDREELKERLKAELIFIDVTKEQALTRMFNDKTRRNKLEQEEIIDYFYKQLEL